MKAQYQLTFALSLGLLLASSHSYNYNLQRIKALSLLSFPIQLRCLPLDFAGLSTLPIA